MDKRHIFLLSVNIREKFSEKLEMNEQKFTLIELIVVW